MREFLQALQRVKSDPSAGQPATPNRAELRNSSQGNSGSDSPGQSGGPFEGPFSRCSGTVSPQVSNLASLAMQKPKFGCVTLQAVLPLSVSPIGYVLSLCWWPLTTVISGRLYGSNASCVRLGHSKCCKLSPTQLMTTSIRAAGG